MYKDEVIKEIQSMIQVRVDVMQDMAENETQTDWATEQIQRCREVMKYVREHLS